ncbi:hypothetical protein PUN28_020448 [Cardiocondyla obscurior]|uniref:Uncharacterized protein n=1 Tax=Cardiocondyla obscurior TaxID=286306 RepID=A0AAW2E5E2_9HYME
MLTCEYFQRSIFTRSRNIDKKRKKNFLKFGNESSCVFENLATNLRAVTSTDAHVTIFSVLPLPEAEILTKNEKINFFNLATYHCAMTKCPRDHFQRFTFTRNRDIDKKRKKKFLKIWQQIFVR